MSGVEIAANVMNALLLDQRLQRATTSQNAMFNMLPVALALLAVLLLAYPLWVRRRLRAAMGYLIEEFQRMEARHDLPTMLPAARSGDLLDQHIDALQNASEQLRNCTASSARPSTACLTRR